MSCLSLVIGYGCDCDMGAVVGVRKVMNGTVRMLPVLLESRAGGALSIPGARAYVFLLVCGFRLPQYALLVSLDNSFASSPPVSPHVLDGWAYLARHS